MHKRFITVLRPSLKQTKLHVYCLKFNKLLILFWQKKTLFVCHKIPVVRRPNLYVVEVTLQLAYVSGKYKQKKTENCIDGSAAMISP